MPEGQSSQTIDQQNANEAAALRHCVARARCEVEVAKRRFAQANSTNRYVAHDLLDDLEQKLRTLIVLERQVCAHDDPDGPYAITGKADPTDKHRSSRTPLPSVGYPDRLRNAIREDLAECDHEMRGGHATQGILAAPTTATDRLMAKLRAQVSEYENAIKQAHIIRATWCKARAGYAVRQPPTGYVVARRGRWRMDPEPSVRASILMVFTDYERLGSIGRVVREYLERGIRLPVQTAEGVRLTQPSRGRIRAILTHPAYKGDYVFGRRVAQDGRTRRRRNSAEVIVVPHHHEAYLSPERWQHVQDQLRMNRPVQLRQDSGTGLGGEPSAVRAFAS